MDSSPGVPRPVHEHPAARPELLLGAAGAATVGPAASEVEPRVLLAALAHPTILDDLDLRVLHERPPHVLV